MMLKHKCLKCSKVLSQKAEAYVLLLLANEQEHQIPAKLTEGKGATADLVGKNWRVCRRLTGRCPRDGTSFKSLA